MTKSRQIQIATMPLGDRVQVLESSPHGLIALEKPAGIMSHPNRKEDRGRCLLEADYDYKNEVYAWETPEGVQRAWLLNRLDSPTSGVLLLTVDERMVSVIRQLFISHKVKKTYYALVKNTPPTFSGCWKDRLKQDAYRSAKVNKFASGSFAQTYYQVINESSRGLPVSLIKLMPVTGRTHQLRIQCHYHQHPIVGDRTHGDFAFNRKVAAAIGEKRMMLHSNEVDLNYRLEGRDYHFCAVSFLPKIFAQVVDF